MITRGARRWPSGTGQWSRIRTVIVATDRQYRATLEDEVDADTALVATPLDVIARLEDAQSLISTVVLTDPAVHRELAEFLVETYPWLEVILDGVEAPPHPTRSRRSDALEHGPRADVEPLPG